MKHLSEEQLLLFHYGEPPYARSEDRRDVTAHLAACAACRSNYDALQRLFSAADAAPVPERGEEYGEQVWQRLRPRLAAEPWREAASWSWWLRPPRWVVAGALAMLLVAAFVLGRFWPHPSAPEVAGVSAQVRDRILLVAVGNHLERSQMVLIELENAPRNGAVDISGAQRTASELVGANRLYRQTALNAGEAGVASVLDQLERVLVDVANSPSEISSKQLAAIQKRIESQGILFKVRVIGSQVKERAKPAGPAARESSGPNRKAT